MFDARSCARLGATQQICARCTRVRRCVVSCVEMQQGSQQCNACDVILYTAGIILVPPPHHNNEQHTIEEPANFEARFRFKIKCKVAR